MNNKVVNTSALVVLYATGFTGVIVGEQAVTGTLAATVLFHGYLRSGGDCFG